MTPGAKQAALTTEQKNRIYGALSLGCDRETAANIVGCTTAEMNGEMQRDPAFAAEVHRTEASTEVSYMRTIYKAIEDPKNWRAAVWWLEMHATDRFKPRGIGDVTIPQLKEFLSVVATIFCEEVENHNDRHRAIRRMYESMRELEELVRAGMRLTTVLPGPLENSHPLLMLTDETDDDSFEENS